MEDMSERTCADITLATLLPYSEFLPNLGQKLCVPVFRLVCLYQVLLVIIIANRLKKL